MHLLGLDPHNKILLRSPPVSAARHGEHVVVVAVVPGDPLAILWCWTFAKVGARVGMFVAWHTLDIHGL